MESEQPPTEMEQESQQNPRIVEMSNVLLNLLLQEILSDPVNFKTLRNLLWVVKSKPSRVNYFLKFTQSETEKGKLELVLHKQTAVRDYVYQESTLTPANPSSTVKDVFTRCLGDGKI